ncbi:glycogen phosphorylase [Limnospira maxima CS-328]|uniref:Alpha-1,4 glucan phosphorylase n=1 Tax=Limnospira maxima CS-328 TaxID=513049 RepID=B5W7F6_LIMMA|nr:glycogen phosphorylase [Limnospira maxima CS-328]
MGRLLPRPLEIIYEINRRFLEEVRNSNGRDGHKIARLSLIDETGERYIRMANWLVWGVTLLMG